jgi:hypothetical protein
MALQAECLRRHFFCGARVGPLAAISKWDVTESLPMLSSIRRLGGECGDFVPTARELPESTSAHQSRQAMEEGAGKRPRIDSHAA